MSPEKEILLAEPRGFCAGVDRAIEIVDRALQKFGRPIYVRHEIVHNTYVVNDLKARGAIFIEALDDVKVQVHTYDAEMGRTGGGVFKTTDGGTTWNKILYTNDSSGVGDMVMDPSNPEKLVVAMWQHRRTPWSFKSGGPGSGLYRSDDGGANWSRVSEA